MDITPSCSWGIISTGTCRTNITIITSLKLQYLHWICGQHVHVFSLCVERYIGVDTVLKRDVATCMHSNANAT